MITIHKTPGSWLTALKKDFEALDDSMGKLISQQDARITEHIKSTEFQVAQLGVIAGEMKVKVDAIPDELEAQYNLIKQAQALIESQANMVHELVMKNKELESEIHSLRTRVLTMENKPTP